MWLILVFLPIAAFLYWQYWKLTHKRLLELAAKIPGPPALPILGNALLFSGDPEEMLHNMAVKPYGEYARFWLGPDLNIAVKNPADIRDLLTSNKLSKKGPTYEFLKPLLGYGLIVGGPNWRQHRKIAITSYNKKCVSQFSPVFNKEAEQMARVISNRDPNVAFDVYKDVVKCTTQCVNQTLMGLTKEESLNISRLDELVEQTRNLYEFGFERMRKWWLQIPFIYWLLGYPIRLKYFTKLVDDFAKDVVEKRRKALAESTPNEETMCIVDRFILSGELSEEEIKLETFTAFTSSQEPTANVASGILMILAHLPDWQDKVYNEMLEVLGPSGPVDAEQLKQLHYLDMVLLETVRYFPAAVLIQRTVLEDVSIDNGRITLPAGISVVFPIHELNNDPQYWEHPKKMMPDRFLPENVKQRDPNVFVPFSLGPMNCLGRIYSPALVKTLVVWVLRYAYLEPAGSLDNIKLHISVSATSADGCHIRARPRHS
ncbi:cytochrome P450 4c3-like [Trichoplusia ni]|uniref:Cytochrome P450 4c3-like n=1 Tax=Trichoplusia ni TaxID=7111 RepID=A0A7E5VG65_TRINI|nr:cytochrome P450 4c3-like [Trichoplusia ni]